MDCPTLGNGIMDARFQSSSPIMHRFVSKVRTDPILPQRDWLADKLARRGGKGVRASERRETDTALAERLLSEALTKVRWLEIDLATRPKGHPVKVKIAQQLRWETPMSRQWIANRLSMGSVSYVSNLLNGVDSKLCPLLPIIRWKAFTSP
jgi:hypothetical protein